MTQRLRLVSAGMTGFTGRQPRVAVGALGLGGLLLTELAVTLLSRAVV